MRTQVSRRSERRSPILSAFPGAPLREALSRVVFALLFASILVPAASALEPRTGRHLEELGPGSLERLRSLDRADFLPALDPPQGVILADSAHLPDSAHFVWGGGANLNRVDGLSLVAVERLVNPGRLPDLLLYEAWGAASHRWSGAFEMRFHPFGPALQIGGRVFDETALQPRPVPAVRPDENFVAALLFREDFYDWMRRRGIAAHATWSPAPGRGLQAAWFDERQESLARVRARLGPFGGKRSFRQNPGIEEGRWGILRFRGMWALGSAPSTWTAFPTVHAALAEAVTSGGRLRGDRQFTRLWGELRGHQRLTPSQSLGYRLGGGWTPQGTPSGGSRLPSQWQFQAGGIGTLRGHRFEEFRGDRLALGTLEYGVDLGTEVRPVLFVDGGKAWNEGQTERGGIGGSGPLALDGGIGLQLGPDPYSVRIDVARDLRAERAPARVTARLGIPY